MSENAKGQRVTREDKSRHNAIISLLSGEHREEIYTLNMLAYYLNKHHGIDTTTGTLSKDKKKIKFIKVGEGNNSHYALPEAGKRNVAITELKEILTTAGITSNSDIKQKNISMCLLRTNGYSHVILSYIKKIFPNALVDVICLENSLIIFFDKTIKEDGRNGLRAELLQILTE